MRLAPGVGSAARAGWVARRNRMCVASPERLPAGKRPDPSGARGAIPRRVAITVAYRKGAGAEGGRDGRQETGGGRRKMVGGRGESTAPGGKEETGGRSQKP